MIVQVMKDLPSRRAGRASPRRLKGNKIPYRFGETKPIGARSLILAAAGLLGLAKKARVCSIRKGEWGIFCKTNPICATWLPQDRDGPQTAGVEFGGGPSVRLKKPPKRRT